MKIGVFGATIFNHNLGCQALSWSFLTFMEKVAAQMNTTFEYIIFDRSVKEDSIKKMCKICQIDRNKVKVILASTPKLHKIKQNSNFINYIKKCDCIIDITQGDSFSDIYGKKRFYTWTIEKRIVQKLGVPLILGPQTYGPFASEKCKSFAAKVIDGAAQVISRDEISTEYLKSLSDKKIVTGIDVAFLLPYHKDTVLDNGKINVGINPSGLIWQKFGQATDKVELTYKANYKEYLKSLVKYLCEEDKYNIYIIPHVNSDVNAAKWLKEEFDGIHVVPMQESATDVKDIIASMDCFIGTRMHATIAAMSSGVPVIPVSYSRKFEGLYSTLNYKYCVSLESMDTNECLDKTIEYLNNLDVIKNAQKKSLTIADEKLNIMKDALAKYLKGLQK